PGLVGAAGQAVDAGGDGRLSGRRLRPRLPDTVWVGHCRAAPAAGPAAARELGPGPRRGYPSVRNATVASAANSLRRLAAAGPISCSRSSPIAPTLRRTPASSKRERGVG